MRGALLLPALALLAGSLRLAQAQTTQRISKFFPTPVSVKIAGQGVFEQTPSFGARRKLAEVQGPGRGLKQLFNIFDLLAFFGPTVTLSEAIVETVAAFTVAGTVSTNVTVTGRRLLDATPTTTFVGEVKKSLQRDEAVASYLFDTTTAAFLKNVAVSGTGATSSFTFLRALLIFPQEGTDTTPPPFAESSTGFLATDPLHPIIVRLSTKGKMDTVPSVALRFDYAQTGTTGGVPVTPFVSIYYTDFASSYPNGLPASSAKSGNAAVNIVQTFNDAQIATGLLTRQE